MIFTEKEYNKIKATIDSCKTVQQCTNAFFWLTNLQLSGVLNGDYSRVAYSDLGFLCQLKSNIILRQNILNSL